MYCIVIQKFLNTQLRFQNLLQQYYVCFYRYNYDNEEFQQLLESMNYTFENAGVQSFGAAFLPEPLAVIVIVSIAS